MDSPESEVGRSSDERQHPVRITRPFAMGKYPVTQSQYEEVIGSNPSYFQEVGPDAPVEGVNWEEAMEFCRRLTERDRDSGLLSKGYAYTLPTEAQWEYACRAGTSTPFSFGESLSSDLANFDGNHPYGAEKGPYLERTTSVGTYLSNAWDLHDMHGNVWEWCYDRYGAHTAEEAVDPRGPETGPYRVVRGGSWYLGARYCRSACRLARDPGERDRDLGFRVAAVPSAELKARERKGQRRARWAFLLPLAQRTEL